MKCLVFLRKRRPLCFLLQAVLHFCRDLAIYHLSGLSIRHFSVRLADNPLLEPIEMRFRDNEIHVTENEKTELSFLAVLRS